MTGTAPLRGGASKQWTHSYKVSVTGSPDRVFAALTNPADLRRWFAEDVDVDVDLRPGGAFRFWGRHTYGAPDRAAARQQLTRVERDRLFAFTWPFEQLDSEVTLELARDAKDQSRTAVALQHTFPSQPAVPYSAELVDDLWRLTLGNLDAHLRGGDGIVLPDFTNPSPEIRLSIVIDAPRDRVFKALIDPEALNQWIASAAVVEPRIGGRYSYDWHYEHGGKQVEGGPTTILDFVENVRLVTDWLDYRGDTTRQSTRVAWLLEDAGSPQRTRLTLVHSGFARAADQSDYPFGWGEFLTRIKTVAEKMPGAA